MSNIPTSGIILLDKPSGISSNFALTKAKKSLGIKKAGHTGSLDPIASGMLPLCFGEATKFARFLLDQDKTYHVVAKLGESTTTGDIEGEIIEQKSVPQLNEVLLKQALEEFIGEITQVPSMYSALKYNGQPLYRLARQGKTVERPARQITIHGIQLEGFKQTEHDATLALVVECSKGTYIRTLIEDLGKKLGCGAHVIALRRLRVGDFEEQQMVGMKEVQTDGHQHFLPIQSALAGYPKFTVPEGADIFLQQGQKIRVGNITNSGWVALCDHAGKFLGVGELLQDGLLAPRRMMQTQTAF